MDYYPLTAPKLHLVCSHGNHFSVRIGDSSQHITLDANATSAPRESTALPQCNRADSTAEFETSAIIHTPTGETLHRHQLSIPGAEAFVDGPSEARGARIPSSWWRHYESELIKTQQVVVISIESSAWVFVADWADQSVWRFDLANRRATLLLEDAACAGVLRATHSSERALVWCEADDDVTPWAFLIDVPNRTTTLVEGGRELLLMPDGTVVGILPMIDADDRTYDVVAILQSPRL